MERSPSTRSNMEKSNCSKNTETKHIFPTLWIKSLHIFPFHKVRSETPGGNLFSSTNNILEKKNVILLFLIFILIETKIFYICRVPHDIFPYVYIVQCSNQGNISSSWNVYHFFLVKTFKIFMSSF